MQDITSTGWSPAGAACLGRAQRATRQLLTPCLLPPALAGLGLRQVRLIQQHSRLPATLRAQGEQVELGAHREPEAVLLAAVTAEHQLLCHSPATCHQEVTGTGIPDRWPCAGPGVSAAFMALLRKLNGDKCACVCQQ